MIGKAKELKYQQFCSYSDICCDISQTELHLHHFFVYRRYGMQILPFLLKGHHIYSSHFQVLQRCFKI